MKNRFVLQTDLGPRDNSPITVWDTEKKVIMANFPMEDRELATKLASVIAISLNESPPKDDQK
jgi:hypothetical protein